MGSSTAPISYYNTLITILVALLGATAIIGYLHLKYLSKEEAEANADKALENWIALEKTNRLLDKRIADQVGEWITDEKTLTGRIELLEGYVEDIRQYSGLPSSVDLEGD